MSVARYGADAATGAAAGAAFGPWGAAIGAVGVPLLDYLSGSGSDDDKVAQAERDKVAQMQKAQGMYQAYRPEVQQAREMALRQQLSAYGGVNQAMGLMYGPQYNPTHFAPNLGNNPYGPGGPISFAPSGAPPAPMVRR